MGGKIGREALVIFAQLSQTIAAKSEELFSQIGGWVNGRIAIKEERSYSRIIHISQLPIPLWERKLDWDTESGIRLVG